jgi:hypothetical protein
MAVRIAGLLLFLLAAGLGRAAGPLTVVNAVIEEGEGGNPLPPGSTLVPGQTMFFSFQVAGYQASSAQKIHLTYKVEAVDAHGVPITEPIASEVDETLAPEDKNWKPLVRHEIAIPPLADSGTYKINISVNDLIGKTSATKEIPFEVHGHHVDPSDTLVIRNFRFYRNEDAPLPLEKPAYRPGDTVWARLDIVGFKYGPGNAVDITCDVSVVAPSGKVLWSQANISVDQSPSFYPKRYVPGSMSINLQPNIHPGEYGMVITAHDRLGSQTYEARQNFTIE